MEDEIKDWTYQPPPVVETVEMTDPPTSSPPSPPRVPQEAKVQPLEAKCGSVAGDAGRGGAAAQAKGCGRLLQDEERPRVRRRIKGRRM